MPKREILPIHPGEMLLEEFIKPYKITPKKLARNIKIAEGYIQELIENKRNITPALALRLAFHFNTSPDFFKFMFCYREVFLPLAIVANSTSLYICIIKISRYHFTPAGIFISDKAYNCRQSFFKCLFSF